jgi:hypothetical protein
MALAIFIIGTLGASLCVSAFGWNAVFLNLWQVPARHPWAIGLKGFALVGLEFLEHASGFIVLFACLWVLDLRFRSQPSTFRESILARPWIVPAAAALLALPISLMGRLKVGGDINAYHSIYYLIAAIGMMAARLTSLENRCSVGIRIGCLSLTILGNIFLFFHHPGLMRTEFLFRNSRLEAEYRFALKHPGEVFFASDPLATLYSDRKLYHQGYGVYDRVLANFPPSSRQLREHIPARMRWVMTPGAPSWVPDNLVPIPAPQGLEGPDWFEMKSAR